MKNLKIKYQKPEKLRPYLDNAKIHSDYQIDLLAGSIKTYGFRDPIEVDEKTNEILAGHGRLLAALKLGLESVPTIAINHLTENQKKAYRLANNRLAEIGVEWDVELVLAEMNDILASDQDIDPEYIGFDIEELEAEPSFGDMGHELSESDFTDEVNLVIKLPDDKYHAATERLNETAETPEAALLKILGIT